jgi:hypothetical protein
MMTAKMQMKTENAYSSEVQNHFKAGGTIVWPFDCFLATPVYKLATSFVSLNNNSQRL